MWISNTKELGQWPNYIRIKSWPIKEIEKQNLKEWWNLLKSFKIQSEFCFGKLLIKKEEEKMEILWKQEKFWSN